MGNKATAVISAAAAVIFAVFCIVTMSSPHEDGISVRTGRSADEAAVLTGEDRQYSPQSDLLTGEKVNINTADAETLMLLPGIGEVLAARIVEYRTENGAFSVPEELMNVSGIGQGLFDSIYESIITEG